MNRRDILNMLLSTLSSFDIHPRLIAELTKIISGSGYELRFFKLLSTRLMYLGRYGPDAIHHEEFELLGSGVFSMHLAGQGFNIRILYSFLPDGSPSLLTCFYEREGKGKTDYSTYIKPAMQRYKEQLEANGYE